MYKILGNWGITFHTFLKNQHYTCNKFNQSLLVFCMFSWHIPLLLCIVIITRAEWGGGDNFSDCDTIVLVLELSLVIGSTGGGWLSHWCQHYTPPQCCCHSITLLECSSGSHQNSEILSKKNIENKSLIIKYFSFTKSTFSRKQFEVKKKTMFSKSRVILK